MKKAIVDGSVTALRSASSVGLGTENLDGFPWTVLESGG